MESIVIGASGINKYDVRRFDTYTYMDDRLDAYLNMPDTKAMLNVGDHSFGTDSQVLVQDNYYIISIVCCLCVQYL